MSITIKPGILSLPLVRPPGVAPVARAAEIPLENATIADLQQAFENGTLTAEKLTEIYLARIAAYDQQGPAINTVITLNLRALDQAKALDAEREAGRVRGPLHGIPIVLKDNYDTFDLPTSGGSQLLKNSMAPDDAYVVKKLRHAGVVILAKVNLHEFAGGGGSVSGARDPETLKAGRVPNGFSSLGLQTKNPHDLTRGPGGSSSGTGAAIAAAFAQFGLGTDTGGSIRNPCSANGLAGLKPTHGLISRDGIIPLALTFDTGGPMARSVYDLAVSLGAMTGVDPADDATKESAGKFEKDYTQFLKKGSLKGARIGVARDYMGIDPETDRVVEEAIVTIKKLGAIMVDPLKYPDYLLQAKEGLFSVVMQSEFKTQIATYLKTTKPEYPKTLDDLVVRANDPKMGYHSPEKAFALKYTASVSLDLDDPVYLAAKNEGLAMVRSAFLALFAKHHLDAIIYPTAPRPATVIAPSGTATGPSGASFANQTGFPDLIVPAGVTQEGLPVTISFFGPAFSEPKLFSYGYDFEQATQAYVLPKTTPALPADTITV